MSFKDFYNKIDLVYPELAINVEPIDRLNPGKCKFYIPILMPYLPQNSLYRKKEYFNNSDMLNVRPNLYDLGSIEITNYIEINVAKEVCYINDIEKNRYIPQNSRWVVEFVGGDINFPVIISKMPD